jgi:hypothetical protein
MCDSIYILQTKLYTQGSEKASEKIEDDLKKEDPTLEVAMAEISENTLEDEKDQR